MVALCEPPRLEVSLTLETRKTFDRKSMCERTLNRLSMVSLAKVNDDRWKS